MLAKKTRIRDGRGRRRKRVLEARKAPGQARSKETVNIILEASARILESEGLRGFNTNSVAAKAGVSVGSLYQYFPNKDAILMALIERFEDAAQEAINEALLSAKGRPLKPSLRLFVRALVETHFSRPKLNRLLEAEEERLGGGSVDFAFHPGLQDLLQEHRREVARAVTNATERVGMAILRAVIDQGLALAGSPRSVERDALRAVTGFLLYRESR
jgi:AcrR family transcriptional regulator